MIPSYVHPIVKFLSEAWQEGCVLLFPSHQTLQTIAMPIYIRGVYQSFVHWALVQSHSAHTHTYTHTCYVHIYVRRCEIYMSNLLWVAVVMSWLYISQNVLLCQWFMHVYIITVELSCVLLFKNVVTLTGLSLHSRQAEASQLWVRRSWVTSQQTQGQSHWQGC